MQEAVHKLVLYLPIALVYMGPQPPHPQRWRFGSPGWQVAQEVTGCLFQIDFLTRGARGRKRRKVREAADDLNARFTAVWTRGDRGIFLTWNDMVNIGAGRVSRAALGSRSQIDDLFKAYDQSGFPAYPDD